MNNDLTHNWIIDSRYDQTCNKYFICTNCSIIKQILKHNYKKIYYFNYLEGNDFKNIKSCNEMIIENILK